MMQMAAEPLLWEPHSSIGWIDVDRDEAKRVRDLLGLFKTPEAIDPHGILPLQLALSDRLFPGMSTQHTRARYVFFVAWHAERIANGMITDHQLREDELALMRGLLESDDTVGVFGKRKREDTQTLPSSVYWTALQRWEILSDDQLSTTISHDRAFRRHQRSRAQLSDDMRESASSKDRLVPVQFPTAPPGFPNNQSLQMTRDEAEALAGRVAATCRDSLLRVVFADHTLASRTYPWPTVGPSEEGEVWSQNLTDAQCFSELIHPARLIYSKLLVEMAQAQRVEVPHLASEIADDLRTWREEIDHRIPALRRWVSEDLERLLNDAGLALRGNRRNFIRTAVTIASRDPDGCLDDPDLAGSVRWIESTVKRGNARLRDGEPFRRWLKQPSRLAAGRLDYRWPTVVQFSNDMAAAI
jgi:hypothetical protein